MRKSVGFIIAESGRPGSPKGERRKELGTWAADRRQVVVLAIIFLGAEAARGVSVTILAAARRRSRTE